MEGLLAIYTHHTEAANLPVIVSAPSSGALCVTTHLAMWQASSNAEGQVTPGKGKAHLSQRSSS